MNDVATQKAGLQEGFAAALSSNEARARYAIIIALVFAAVLAVFFPLFVYSIPVYLGETFLFFLCTRTSRTEFRFSVALYISSLLVLVATTELPLAVVGFVLAEAMIIRYLTQRAVGLTVSEAIVFCYFILLPLMGIAIYVSYQQLDVTVLRVSRKILDLFFCLIIFELIDKTINFYSRSAGKTVPFFTASYPIRGFLQSILGVGIALMICGIASVDASYRERDLVLVAKEHVSEQRQAFIGRLLDKADDVLLSTNTQNVALAKTWDIRSAAAALKIDGLLDVHVYRLGASFQDDAEQFVSESELVKKSLAVPQARSYYVAQDLGSANAPWALLVRSSYDTVIEFVFEDAGSLSAFMSVKGFQFDITPDDAADPRPRGALFDLPSTRTYRKEYGDGELSFWVSDTRLHRNNAISPALLPGSSFAQFHSGAPSLPGETAFRQTMTVGAWSYYLQSMHEFSLMMIASFSGYALFMAVCAAMIQVALRPYREFSEELGVKSAALAASPDQYFSIPAIRPTMVVEADQSQQAFVALLGAIDALAGNMRDSVDSYESLVATVPLGLLAVDASGEIVSVNEGLADICKLSVPALEAITGESQQMEFSLHGRAERRLDILSGDGTTRNLAIKKVLRMGAQGKPDGHWLIVVDLTEEKLKDAQLAQTSKLATLGQMSTEIAHELNQPLNVLALCQANISSQIGKDEIDREQVLKKVQRMKGAIDRASRIINHMRTYGRVAPEELILVDVRDAIRGAYSMTSEQLKLLGVNVELRLAITPLKAMAQTNRLEQVILNLISNAKDAAVDNNDMPHMLIEAFSRNGKVVIRVSDNGGGVAEGDLFKIFEPFYTTKLAGEGTGLGGSISYGIIKDMGGTIQAANIDGGLEVTIQLVEHGGELEVSRSANSS